MKMTVTESYFANSMKLNGFSYQGAIALFEYLEEVDPDMELDAVALRCDYSEYSSALEALKDTASKEELEEVLELEEDEQEDAAQEKLNYNTCVIEFQGGIIIQSF